jgi:hypothetical protein
MPLVTMPTGESFGHHESDHPEIRYAVFIMKTACCRHPEQPARFTCPKCKLPFCSGCVVTLDASTIGGKQVVQFCPKCMIAVRTLGAADKVLPFWKRLFTGPDVTPPKTRARSHPGNPGSTSIDSESNLCRQIDKLRRDDNSDQALEYIRQWLKNGGRLSAALAGRYIDLLIQNGQSAELCSRTKQLLHLLVQAGDKRRAIAVFDICHAEEGDVPIDPAILVNIGEMLSADGRARDAIRIYGAVIKHQPDAPEAFLAYFKASQIYHERFKNPEKAEKILRQLIQKYPEHSMLPDVKSYLKTIR